MNLTSLRNCTALTAAVFLSACASTSLQAPRDGGIENPLAEIAYFKKVLATTPSNPATSAQAADLITALDSYAGDWIGMSYASVEETETGTFIDDLVFTIPASGGVTVEMDEVHLWGVDTDSVSQLKGDTSDVAAVYLADRIEVRGFELSGVNELVSGFLSDLEGEIEIEGEAGFSLDSFSMKTERMILDGMVLHPDELHNIPEFSEEKGFWPFVQAMAAGSRYVSYDRTVSENSTGQFGFTMPLQSFKMDMTIPFVAARGASKGDVELQVTQNLTVSTVQTMELPMNVEGEVADHAELDKGEAPNGKQAALQSNVFTVQSEVSQDLSIVEGTSISRLTAYLKDGQMPPVTDTDLISLGKWLTLGETQSMSGLPIYSAEKQYIDLSEFYWFLPTSVKYKIKGATYNIGNLINPPIDQNFYREASTSEVEHGLSDPKMLAQGGGHLLMATLIQEGTGMAPQQIVNVLDKNGLGVLNFDMGMSYSWSPDNGAISISTRQKYHDVFDIVLNNSGQVLDYASIVSLIPEKVEDFKPELLSQAMMRQSGLDGFLFSLEDNGGIEKLLGVTIDFAKLAPPNSGGATDMFREATPESLRAFMATTMRMAAAGVAQTFPPAVDWINSAADFVTSGGTITAEAAPAKMITSEVVMQAMSAPDFSPQKLVDLLGFSVMHEEPAAE